MSSKNPKYTQEYKQSIVNLYHVGKTYSEILIIQLNLAVFELPEI